MRRGAGAPRSLSYEIVGGNGGVGKTMAAAVIALAAARRPRALVLSSDPVHSPGDALARRLGPRTRRVRALLTTLLKYHRVLGLGALATDLIDLSRGVRRLQGRSAMPGARASSS